MPEHLVLKGLAASAGQIEGTAQVFLPGEDAKDFVDGNILVTTLTDPTMANVLVKAVGIVADMGGITSHPAILSREMGIPCVVNTKTGTTTITTGMKIRLDGSTGEVYELD
jgi:pyruvate,water dikinase